MNASSMILSIRNNLSLLSNRKKLKHRLGGYNPEVKTEYNLPKATTKELNALGKRMREEHNVRMTKIITVTIILFLGLVYAFVYASDGIIELLTY